MQAGRLDRRITIQDPNLAQDASGEPVPGTPIPLATVWAERNDGRGREYFTGRQEIAERVTRFAIRHMPGILETHEIDENGTIWQIEGIREIGRDEDIHLFCTTKAARD